HEVAIVAEPVSNTLLLSANPRYFSQIKQLIEKLDQPQPQVLIQVLLAEVTLDSTHELGIEWNVTKTVEDAKLLTGTDFGVAGDLKTLGGFATAVTGSDYNFLLRALQEDERRAMTSVSVQSGQSIIIGGLISSSDDNHTKKVPFLGDVPVLGALFRSKTKITERKELLILLTPQVLVNVKDTPILSDTRSVT